MTASLRSDLDDSRPRSLPWAEYEAWVMPRWHRLLESGPAEDAVQHFLEQNPALVPGGAGDIGPGGHHGAHLDGVFRQPELQGLGRRQLPDFMWITRSTSTVTPICIEIEQPDRRWFNLKGDPTGELTHARQQITRWRSWFSESPNQEIFRSRYLQHQYDNRRLHPVYLLVYGRAAEFEKGSSPHRDTDALRKARDLAVGPDETFMTFDSLRPRYDCKDYVTLTMAAAGLEVHSLPPTFTTGPLSMTLAAEVPVPEAAIRRTPLWSDDRKEYVLRRWKHWKQTAAGPNRPYTLESGE